MNPVPDIKAEICVIGGGPAGATIARKLALLGHDVVLVEKTDNSGNKVGESLPPNILVLLDALGVRERIEEAAFLRPGEAVVHWSGVPAAPPRSSNGHRGFTVNRGRFDQILVEAAKEAGVRVIQEATALAPVFDEAQGWTIPVRFQGGMLSIAAKYLVLASGKNSFWGRDRKRRSASTIALCGYWRDVDIANAGALVEAGADEWFWGAHLPDGSFSAMVFIDARARRAAENRGNPESLYRSLLGRSSLLRGCLSGTLIGKVKGCDASSYIDSNPVTRHLIKVGDASFSIDPLSSQGVQAAITSALQGSFVVHTILTRPENADDAIQFYRERQEETVSRHHHFAASSYSEAFLSDSREFFRIRAAASPAGQPEISPPARKLTEDLHLRLSDKASFVKTPCIAGDIIESIPALTFAGAERPIAYLNGVEIVSLLEMVPNGGTPAQIAAIWSPHIPVSDGLRIVNWLYEIGVLTC